MKRERGRERPVEVLLQQYSVDSGHSKESKESVFIRLLTVGRKKKNRAECPSMPPLRC